MDASVFLVAFGAFLGGLFVVARVSAWVAGIVVFFKPSGPATAQPNAAYVLAPLFLHSGPWLLAVAVTAVWYAASSARAAYLWAVVSGLVLAMAIVGTAVVLAYVRQKRPRPEPQPLTPQRFLELRRQFFWRNSLFFGIALPVGFAVFDPFPAARNVAFLVITFLSSFAGGWLWSWFMWQLYGENLKLIEKARAKRATDNAV